MPILRDRPRYYTWRLSGRNDTPLYEVRDSQTGRRAFGTSRYQGLDAQGSSKRKMDRMNEDWERYLVLRQPGAPHSLCATGL